MDRKTQSSKIISPVEAGISTSALLVGGNKYGKYVLAAVAVAIAVRIFGMAIKTHWTHDECVSYIAATGHQGEYLNTIQTKSPPYGVWTNCGNWKYFIRPVEKWCFLTIQQGLISADIHPPLYFWTLHIFCLLFGVRLWTGVLLNIIIVCIGVMILWKMVLWMDLDKKAAFFVVALWSWSPAAVQTSLEARPYDLLTLAAIFFMWRLLKVVYAKTVTLIDVGILIMAAVIGLLCHYHFYLLLLGAFLYLGYQACKKRNHNAFIAAMAIFITIIIGNLIHTGIDMALQRLNEELIFTDGWIKRMDRIILAISSFLSNIHLIQYLLIVIGIICLIRLIIIKKAPFVISLLLPSKTKAVFFIASSFAVLVILLYALGFSPPHAMGEKYLSPLWPFIVIVYISWASLNHFRIKWLLFMLALMLIQTTLGVARPMFQHPSQEDPERIYNQMDAVVVDNVARGELLRLIWYVPEEKKIFAAHQSDLLNRQDWQQMISCKTGYLSKRSYGNTRKAQQEILLNWPEICKPKMIHGVNYGLGEFFFAVDGK